MPEVQLLVGHPACSALQWSYEPGVTTALPFRVLALEVLVTGAVREAVDRRFVLRELPATPVHDLHDE